MSLGVVAVALAACGGGDKPASEASADMTAGAPPAAEQVAVASAGAGAGEVLYARCVTCHQMNGEGMAGAFPPLAGSEWVNGPASHPIAVVLHGMQGPITVKGVSYNAAMIAYGTGVPMSDQEVADVVSYVRTTWGNASGPVTAEDVATVRAATATRTRPWTAAELAALK